MSIPNLSLADAKKKIDEYLRADLRYASAPFFVTLEAPSEYKTLYSELITRMAVIKATDAFYGHGVNSVPSSDRLEELVDETDAEQILILGLGDAWALTCGNDAFSNPEAALRFLKDDCLGKKVVVLLLNAYPIMETFSLKDGKFDERRWIHVVADEKKRKHFKATRLDPELVKEDVQTYRRKKVLTGLYGLLEILQVGDIGEFYVRTELPLNLYDTIESAYDLLQQQSKSPVQLDREALDDEHWQVLLDAKGKLKAPDVMSWQAFYKFKTGEDPINGYHKLVLDNSKSEHEYAEKLFTTLLDVKRNDPKFKELYFQRKELLAPISLEASVEERAKYLQAVQFLDAKERFYYLTDATEQERTLILELLAQFDAIPQELRYVYPDLAKYFDQDELDLDCADATLTAQITEYFRQYRLIKLHGKLTDEFLTRVDALALPVGRPWTNFNYRNPLLEGYAKDDAPLLWIDALGVEFLPYIVQKAQELGLEAEFQIARADHPTTTDRNKDFYDNWQAPKLPKVKELDELLHENASDASSTVPLYLLKELEIITKALTDARELLLAEESQVVIASDHGASRLAVLAGQKWTDDVPGQAYNSGRFCDACDELAMPVTAIEVDDPLNPGKKLWVFANYNRFHGQGGTGKKGGVEVHGGATLEETLVPVICLTKAAKVKLAVKKVDANLKTKGTGQFAMITILLTQKAKNPTLLFNGRTFAPLPPDPTAPLRVQFDVAEALEDIDSGEQVFLLFDRKKKVGTITLTVKSHLGKQQSAASGDLFKF